MKLSHSRAVVLMVLATFLWSIAGVVTRYLESAQRFEITFWRSLFTLASLLVILPFFQGRKVFTTLREGGGPLWLSGVCWSVMFTAFMVALTLTSVANVLVTMAISPFLTAVLARVVIGQPIPGRTWGAIFVAGTGIAWMYGSQADLGSNLAGTMVALLVPFASATNWTVVQYTRTQGNTIDMVPAVLVGAVISVATMLPLAYPFLATPKDLALLAMLGLFQLAIPCVLVVMCAGVLKAPEVALLGLLEVLFGILLAWLGANEVPTQAVLTGGTLVIGALVINELLGWRQRL